MLMVNDCECYIDMPKTESKYTVVKQNKIAAHT